VSIINRYKALDNQNRFIVKFIFWLIVLFGLFYWGRFWSYSPIGEYIDSGLRAIIMPILDALLDNSIDKYDILINSKYSVVITPECNGIIPYLMILAAILAYPCPAKRKFIYAISSAIIFFVMNILRLYIVVEVVNRFGANSFYLIHDIFGNLLLMATGAFIFLSYLKCNKRDNAI